MHDRSPSRRQFLVAGSAVAATALSGCLDTSERSADSKRVLSLELSREEGTLRENFVTDLSQTRLEWDEEAFETARDGGTYTSQYRKPFYSNPDDPVYTERNGTYYRLRSVVVDEVTTTRPVLRLSSVGDPNDASTPDGVPASELPTGDERAIRAAYFAARARGNEGGVPWGVVQRGGYVYRNDEAIDASRVLADDGPGHVTYRETVYAVDVADERFHEPVYRATVDPVAETPDRMEAILRAQFVDARISRADLSSAARDVLQSARDDYSESHPYSEAYREVLRALHERPYVDGNVRKDAGVDDEGRQMLRYDDTYYDYRLRFRP